MATRRPKVPRATPAAPKSPENGDGGDVIQADFGATRGSQPLPAGAAGPAPRNTPAPSTPTAPRNPATPDSTQRGAAAPAKDRAAPAGDSLDPVPAKAFSGRMLALFVVMIAITIMLAPTVKIFFEKRAEIAALQADISAKQDQQGELRRQVSRWQDPNYVKQQARDRINMVMPGETGYWVFGSDLPAGSPSGAAGAGSAQDPAELPWVDALWESVRRSATD